MPTPSAVTIGTPVARELAHGRRAQMIEVIVRHEHRIERRQLAHVHGHRMKPPRPDHRARPDAVREHRIGQHAATVDLEQHRRVPEPRRAQPALDRRRPRPRPLDRQRQRRAPFLPAEHPLSQHPAARAAPHALLQAPGIAEPSVVKLPRRQARVQRANPRCARGRCRPPRRMSTRPTAVLALQCLQRMRMCRHLHGDSAALAGRARGPRPQQRGQAYGSNRRTVGRLAIAELVAAVVPPSHAAFAATVRDRDLWGFLHPGGDPRQSRRRAPARARGSRRVPHPLWPLLGQLACLVGAPPAHYVGNNLIMLPPEVVDAGSTHSRASSPRSSRPRSSTSSSAPPPTAPTPCCCTGTTASAR